MNDIVVAGYELGIAQAAITTLATMMTIGIAFLIKPTPATLYWTFAFTLAMVATYGVVAGEINDAETIRRVSLGALMGAPALLWSGFRSLWGLRPHLWAGGVVALAGALVLGLAPDVVWFTVAYRSVFLAASVFALLFFLDWMKASERRGDRVLLPFAIVSGAFVVVAAGTFIGGLVFLPSGGDDFGLVRMISSIGMLAYVGCALVAVVGIATREGAASRAASSATDWQRFESTAAERLLRAQRTSEPWSVVHLRLDDADDIRQTAGATALANLSARFEEEARTVFPAESDLGSPSPGNIVVLVPRAETAVREALRTILDRVPLLDTHGSLPIRPTASAGWAPVSMLGYELDALVYTAREAAVLAGERGGDRWERVDGTVMERLVRATERP